MKSLSILILLFAASQALWIDDYGPKESVTINHGGDLTLFCTTQQKWDKCVFFHESNRKSCTIDWKKIDKTFQEKDCDNKMTTGSGINRKNCTVVIKKADVNEDDGKWTCKMTNNKNEDTRDFQVSLIKGTGENLDHNKSKELDPTTSPKLMGGGGADGTGFVRNAILAFTFLITAVFVVGCVILLPKHWQLLRSQCTWN